MTGTRPPWTGAQRALVVLLVLGVVLRILIEVAWQPAFLGWPDGQVYLQSAIGNPFDFALRPGGYPLFVAGLNLIHPSINLIVLVNHLMGLGTAVLLYLSVVRAGAPRVVGLVPLGVLALGGDGIFLEQAPLSEPLFIFLIAVGLYAAVRTIGGGRWWWALLAGLAISASATVREVGLALLPVFGLWLLLAAGEGWRRRGWRRKLLCVAVGAVAAGAVIGVYNVAEYQTMGKTGLARNGAWHLYGRVAPFADCSKFTPPPGTQVLCETSKRSRRPYVDAYIYSWWFSPAVRSYGWFPKSSPRVTAALDAWTWQVLTHQPLDYVREVGAGLLRYVLPDNLGLKGAGGGPSYAEFLGMMQNPLLNSSGLYVIKRHYGWRSSTHLIHWNLVRPLISYAGLTRIDGPVMVLLLLLGLLAPWFTRGPTRRAAILFFLTAITLFVVPVATLEFSARTAVPGFGALAAAAGLGGHGVLEAARRRFRATRPLLERATG